MKSLTTILLLTFAAGTLGACHNYEHHGHPHGCPPGQAKKGNCHHYN